jgi:hypothetical protein
MENIMKKDFCDICGSEVTAENSGKDLDFGGMHNGLRVSAVATVRVESLENGGDICKACVVGMVQGTPAPEPAEPAEPKA